MRLTTKGRYAVTAMLDLVFHQEQNVVTLSSIAKRQSISLSYLEQLFTKLRRHKLVVSSRGPKGGYRLSKSAQKIAVGDIIKAVDETIDISNCQGQGNCHEGEECLPHQLWSDLSGMIQEYLDKIYLSDLITRHNTKSDTTDKST